MDQWIENLGRLIAIVVPILGGIFWLSKRNDKANARLSKQIGKIDKHKVSYKVCDQRRAESPCAAMKRKG